MQGHNGDADAEQGLAHKLHAYSLWTPAATHSLEADHEACLGRYDIDA